MTTKEYLKQYKNVCGQIRRFKERIFQIETNLLKSIELDGLPKSTNIGDPTSETALKIMDIKSKLNERIIEAELLKQNICDEIENMFTPTYKELIYSRYILQLTWEEVTDRVSADRRERYDVKHVMSYMHKEALKEFERNNNEIHHNVWGKI